MSADERLGSLILNTWRGDDGWHVTVRTCGADGRGTRVDRYSGFSLDELPQLLEDTLGAYGGA